jgi:hypothetical protein
MASEEQLPVPFVAHSADVLGSTNGGLTGTEIVRLMRGYASHYGVNIPHPIYPFDAPNKRSALYNNLCVFKGFQQHRILRELCDYNAPAQMTPERRQIKMALATTYKHYDTETDASSVNEDSLMKHAIGSTFVLLHLQSTTMPSKNTVPTCSNGMSWTICAWHLRFC